MFRSFVRNVTQLHLSSDAVARASWQARWPNTALNSHRQVHTDTDSNTLVPEEASKSTTAGASHSSNSHHDPHLETTPPSRPPEFPKKLRWRDRHALQGPVTAQGIRPDGRPESGNTREFPKKPRWRDRDASQGPVADRVTRPGGRPGFEDTRELPKKPRWRDRDASQGPVADRGTRPGGRPGSENTREYSKPWEGRAASRKDDQRPQESAEERRARWDRKNQTHKLQKEGKLSEEERAERKALRNMDPKEKNRRRKEKQPMWALQKEALKEKFPEGWQPRKRLSPDAIAGIKELHKQFPDLYTTAALAQKFEVSAEAIRRILKAKWQPTAEEEEDRQERWFRRGQSVWTRWAELGLKPPKKWQEEGIERRTPPTRQQIGPWSQDEQQPWNAEDVDPEKARRLKLQSRITQNLV